MISERKFPKGERNNLLKRIVELDREIMISTWKVRKIYKLLDSEGEMAKICPEKRLEDILDNLEFLLISLLFSEATDKKIKEPGIGG